MAKNKRQKFFLDLVTLCIRYKNRQPYIQINLPSFPLGYQEPVLRKEKCIKNFSVKEESHPTSMLLFLSTVSVFLKNY